MGCLSLSLEDLNFKLHQKPCGAQRNGRTRCQALEDRFGSQRGACIADRESVAEPLPKHNCQLYSLLLLIP